MNQKFLKITVFIIILSFYASFLVVKIGLPASDNDAGLYITDGKVIWQTQKVFRQNIYSYTVPEYPVYDHHWLASVMFYFTHEFFGFSGLTLLKTLILLSAFAILFGAALKKANFWLVAVASLPTILILSQRPRIRPEMFSYLFIAIFLYFLFDLEKHPGRKRIFWLVPLQLLWVNFHLFFFVGIALVGGFLFEKIILHIFKIRQPPFLAEPRQRRWLADWRVNLRNLWNDPIVKKLFLILPMLFIVTFVNPNGLEGMLAPLKTHSYATFTVSENQPLFNLKANIFSWDIFSSAFVTMIAIFLLSFAFGFRNKPIFFLLAGLGSAGTGLIQVRLVTLFSLIFLPAIASNFDGVFRVIKGFMMRKLPKVAVAAGYVSIFTIITLFPYKAYTLNSEMALQGYKYGWGMGLDRYSNNAGKFFKEHNIKGPIFNDYDIGGYIIYHLFPNEKVFVDNNGADSYPVSFFDDIFVPALSREDRWLKTQEQYGINTIFISIRAAGPAVGGFLWNRFHDPSWALVYADAYAVILVRDIPENQAVIKKFRITAENVKDTIGYLLQSSDVIDRIVGGRILYLIGREDLATSALKKVVADFPKNSWAWLYMGAIKASGNELPDIISAIVFLKNAVDMGEKTSEAYTWLGYAYFKFGQFEKAEDAFQKALWLDPSRPDTTNYLKQLQAYLK